jgi:hypothetical protein
MIVDRREMRDTIYRILRKLHGNHTLNDKPLQIEQ